MQSKCSFCGYDTDANSHERAALKYDLDAKDAEIAALKIELRDAVEQGEEIDEDRKANLARANQRILDLESMNLEQRKRIEKLETRIGKGLIGLEDLCSILKASQVFAIDHIHRQIHDIRKTLAEDDQETNANSKP